MSRRLVFLFFLALGAAGFLGRGVSARADAAEAAAAGQGFLAAGRLGDAEEAFLRATRAAPGMASAWRGLADARARRGDFAGAIAAIHEARRLAPRDTAAALLGTRILLAADSHAEAARAAQEILESAPGEAEAMRLLGFARWALGEPDEALRSFGLALRRNDRDSEAWLGTGLAREARGETPAAIEAYRAALALDTSYLDAHRRYAGLLSLSGRPREAEVHLRAATRLGGASGDYLELSHFLAERGAARDAERLLAEARTSGEVGATARLLYTRGILLERTGDFAAARSLLAEAYLANPEDAVARARYEDLLVSSLASTDTERVRLASRRLAEARAARAAGDLAEAERILRRAVRLAPQVSEIRLEKARLLAKRRAYGDALREAVWARELTRDPAERFAIADAEERWVAEGLDQIETTTLVSFREVRLSLPPARRDFLRETEALESKLGWLPGPWPLPKYNLQISHFQEIVPPFHAEIGRTLDRFLAEALREREEIAIRAAGPSASGAAPPRDGRADGLVTGEILERQDLVRISFRLESRDGARLLDRTIETRGPNAFARAAAAMARALAGAIQPEGQILHLDEAGAAPGANVFVNLGARNGLHAGDRLLVVAPRGEPLIPGVPRPGLETRAVLRVVAVEDRFARAVREGPISTPLHLLDRVRRRET